MLTDATSDDSPTSTAFFISSSSLIVASKPSSFDRAEIWSGLRASVCGRRRQEGGGRREMAERYVSSGAATLIKRTHRNVFVCLMPLLVKRAMPSV